MSFMKRLNDMRDAGMVRRYHTKTLLVPETVGQHTFNMLNLAMVLTHGQASKELLFAILTHDMGEYKTGDIPSPVKKALPPEAAAALLNMEMDAMLDHHPEIRVILPPADQRLMAMVDNMDGLLKCLDELRRGNTPIQVVGSRYAGYLMSLTDNDDTYALEVGEVIHAWNTEVKRHAHQG